VSTPNKADLLARLDTLTPQELKRYLVQELTRKKLGLVWEADLIERDSALNANMVFPQIDPNLSQFAPGSTSSGNFVIEGDNFDSLRLLKATHAGKIRVILIDPPYNTGNKDWVYNDDYVNKDDRWRHSKWLEFMYQRMTLARDLLTPDGVILICINDENRSRLELMMDEVMPGRKVGSLVWRTRDTTSAKGRNFSDVHEHVLIYSGEGFSFNGQTKSQKKYKNPDNDPRGPWNGDPLTLAFDRIERENLYYPIKNPETGYWYPCDENRVWAYATEGRVSKNKSLQAETMEEFIRRKQIIFPADDKVVVWSSLSEIYAAIESGDVPVTPKRKRPLLSRDTPDLEFWVGKPVAFGRPLFKKFWSDLRSHTNPLSSWIFRVNEIYDDEDYAAITSPQAGEGTEAIQAIFGRKSFQYPKPPALIKNLLAQASNGQDTVLDFFAGSGTTGHAVLDLNAEDGGNRTFILCSSTEATVKEPTKNLCRDVCAERIRRVIAGYGNTKGLGGDFAYLTLALIEEADLMFDATAQHAYALLCLRETGSVKLTSDSPVWVVSSSENAAIVVCPSCDDAAVSELLAMGLSRVIVYTDRPDSMRQQLEDAGVSAEAHSLETALRFGQQARSFSVAAPEVA
jgi:adenine-specific DNA-methyltransferase